MREHRQPALPAAERQGRREGPETKVRTQLGRLHRLSEGLAGALGRLEIHGSHDPNMRAIAEELVPLVVEATRLPLDVLGLTAEEWDSFVAKHERRGS